MHGRGRCHSDWRSRLGARVISILVIASMEADRLWSAVAASILAVIVTTALWWYRIPVAERPVDFAWEVPEEARQVALISHGKTDFSDSSVTKAAIGVVMCFRVRLYTLSRRPKRVPA
jgi:hypothetical protein